MEHGWQRTFADEWIFCGNHVGDQPQRLFPVDSAVNWKAQFNHRWTWLKIFDVVFANQHEINRRKLAQFVSDKSAPHCGIRMHPQFMTASSASTAELRINEGMKNPCDN